MENNICPKCNSVMELIGFYYNKKYYQCKKCDYKKLK
jgi:tRNA(Ile2) C34 agmatinyltransferase TiaS